MDLTIRPEYSADVAAIHALNAAAFDTDAEARLVDALRAAGRMVLSLVAEDAEGLAGQISFTKVTLTGADGRVTAGVALGPMAARPGMQRRGVGSRLVEEGLRRLREGGHRFCVVLGHSDYFPRFGFTPTKGFGIRWERDVPPSLFMIQPLREGGLDGLEGVVHYAPEFSET
jgi:putative acetyltransferase